MLLPPRIPRAGRQRLRGTGTLRCYRDWGALDRLHAKGMISDPRSKAKSVVLTDEGREEALRLFRALFSR